MKIRNVFLCCLLAPALLSNLGGQSEKSSLQDQVQSLFQAAQRSIAERETARAESELRQVLGLVLLRLGSALQEEGKIERAEGAYVEATRASILTDRGLVNLVKFYALTGQYQKGLESVELLLEINPIHPPGRHLLGQLQILNGQAEAASHSLRDAYIASEKDPEVGLSLAYSYLAKNDLANAETVLDGLSGGKAVPTDLQLKVGRAFLETGHAEQALPYLKQAVSGDAPNVAVARYYLRQALLGLGRNSEADGLVGVAADIDSKHSVLVEALLEERAGAGAPPELVATLRRWAAFAYGKLGEVEMQTENFERASNHFSLARAWDAELAGIAVLQGMAYFREGKTVKAADSVIAAVQGEPANVQALQLLAQIAVQLTQEGSFDKAMACVELLLQKDPGAPFLLVLRGRIRAQTGRLDAALEDFAAALSKNPSFPEAHYNSGVLLLQQGKAEEALAHFNQEIQLSPDHDMARLRKALALVELDRDEEARPILERMRTDNPEAGDPLAVLAQLHARQGNWGEALPLLEQAARLEPQTARFQLSLAEAYRQLGRTEDAEAAMKRYEALQAPPR